MVFFGEVVMFAHVFQIPGSWWRLQDNLRLACAREPKSDGFEAALEVGGRGAFLRIICN